MSEENQVHVLSEESLRARVGRALETPSASNEGATFLNVSAELQAAFHDGQAVGRRQPPEVGQMPLSASESVEASRAELEELLVDVGRGLDDLDVWLQAVEGMRDVLGRGNKEYIRAPYEMALGSLVKLRIRLLGMPKPSVGEGE